MQTDNSLFHEIIESIDGFERFDDRRLPQWLRERLIRHGRDPNSVTDEQLIERMANYGTREWLQNVGTAVIYGQEYLLLHSDFADEALWFAYCFSCGIGYPMTAYWEQPAGDHVVCLSPTPAVTMAPDRLACAVQSH